MKYPGNIKHKTKNFPIAPENKKTKPQDFSDYLKETIPNTYTQNKKLISDWSDEKKCLIHYRMLKFVLHLVWK